MKLVSFNMFGLIILNKELNITTNACREEMKLPSGITDDLIHLVNSSLSCIIVVNEAKPTNIMAK